MKTCDIIPVGGSWLRAGLLRAQELANAAIKDWLEMRFAAFGACLGIVIGPGAELHSRHATWEKFRSVVSETGQTNWGARDAIVQARSYAFPILSYDSQSKRPHR